MKVFGVIIGGGIALMALGIATAHWQAPGMLSHVTGQAGSIEQRVETAARAAIDALGYEWAEIEADGQIVTLRGLAPREEERVLAVNALLNAHGQGGFWRGGVISVVDRSEIAPVASPFVWRASRRDGEVRITGVVPSREARRDLLEFAASAFPEPVRAEITIARGAPSESSWPAIARTALAELASLSEGVAILKDTRLTLEGVADSADTADRVRRELARLPAPFVAAARLEGGEGPSAESLVEVVRAETIRDAGLCQSLVDELMAEGAIDFEAGQSLLEKDSYTTLDRLALALSRCQDMQITVRGHTDSSGDPQANARLSLNRAQRVLDYFVLSGLESERLTAEGLGDTMPVASNETEAGRAQNRRIELVVTR